MGIAFTRLFPSLFGEKEVRIVVLGHCCAGKTTIFNRLRRQEEVSTIPTIGFDLETVEYKDKKFEVYDIGWYFWNLSRRQNSINGPYGFFRSYLPNTKAIIYVVDSRDQLEWHSLVAIKEEIHAIMEQEELKDVVLLIYANKQDLPGAFDDVAIASALELHKLKKNRQWAVFKTIATTGEGVSDGLDWLSDTLRKSGV